MELECFLNQKILSFNLRLILVYVNTLIETYNILYVICWRNETTWWDNKKMGNKFRRFRKSGGDCWFLKAFKMKPNFRKNFEIIVVPILSIIRISTYYNVFANGTDCPVCVFVDHNFSSFHLFKICAFLKNA